MLKCDKQSILSDLIWEYWTIEKSLLVDNEEKTMINIQ